MPVDEKQRSDRSWRPEVAVSYVRRRRNVGKCWNLAAHTAPYFWREATAHTTWNLRSDLFAKWTKAEVENAGVGHLFQRAPEVNTVEARFRTLAKEWSRDVSNVSSVGVLTSHPKYKQIVRLGWDVVPFLLVDLQSNRGFWFTALNEITGIRPFDSSDAGNSRRMTEAWIKWGRRKGII